MKSLVLSMGASILVLGAAWAQNTGTGGSQIQLPVGQSFKNFEYPFYEAGVLKYTAYATEAKGITLNRAETTDLKIEIYDNGAVTTTITSPKADVYLNQSEKEQKMRTKNTVLIVRSDMTATAQSCDFDLVAKQYLLRTNVKVVLKNFDASLTPPAPAASGHMAPSIAPTPGPDQSTIRHPLNDESLLNSPGAFANTNSAPITPTSPDTK